MRATKNCARAPSVCRRAARRVRVRSSSATSELARYGRPNRRSQIMKRTARHPLLVVCLSIAFATAVFAQQDFSKVEIKTTKLAGNLYSLEGQGGAIGVLTGPDGVLMVDSQFAPLTERI